MKNRYDAVIIGSGPAGLACGTVLADKGLSVALLDEQAAPGGQIYRNITKASPKQHAVLGPDYTAGLELVQAFQKTSVDYLPQARVWQAESNGDVYYSHLDKSNKVHGEYLVISTGAMERPVPFPGWTLPGVMTCGGMSNLFKDSSLSPQKTVILAGSGPLLWLVAEHMLALKTPIAAILDTTPMAQVIPAMKHLPKALRRFGYMMKGVKMIADVHIHARKAKVPIYRNVTSLRAEGESRLTRVKANCGMKEMVFEASTLMVSEGVIPNVALLRQIGCQHTWDPVQRYWYPKVEEDGRSNLPTVFVAGDGNFVHGAKSAELKGRLTAYTIAYEMHRISRDEYETLSSAVKKELEVELCPRPFIDAMYAPRKDLYTISDTTVVCRCEGVTAGRIRDLVEEGYTDHNEIKAIIRCGMGPCQGRMCGPAVMELICAGTKVAPEKIRQHRLRPPIKPVSLQELANAEIGGTNEN